jgi:hypothetical protein
VSQSSGPPWHRVDIATWGFFGKRNRIWIEGPVSTDYIDIMRAGPDGVPANILAMWAWRDQLHFVCDDGIHRVLRDWDDPSTITVMTMTRWTDQ